MLTKTLKRVKLRGRIDTLVREQYLRDDLPCHSPVCGSCTSIQTQIPKSMQLEKDATHYVIPCLDVVTKYLEILELQDIKGIILLQSIASKVMQSYGRHFYDRVLNLCKDIRRGSIVFLNEICKDAYVPRLTSESLDEWIMKCCIKAAEYYADHLKRAIPIILVSENAEEYQSVIKHDAVKICSLKEYLETMWPGLDSALQLYESFTCALSAGSVKDLSKSYENYLPTEILEAGIKAGRFYKGYLRVNKHNALQEAFVTSSKSFIKDSGDIFICGMIDRNRAIHGDEVVVEMLPEQQWKSRSLHLVDNPYDAKENGVDVELAKSQAIPTGKIVGILDRRWRNYIATLPEEEESNSSSRKNERILVIPYDYRIPKIRIVTKQAEGIRNRRIVVRIDNWDKESQYPNGHLVQTLGEIGELETEIQCLLIEHDIFVGEFAQNLILELPSVSEVKPWKPDESEIKTRRDLRSSHLIFSIDPKGCEDVDDALSIKELPNGMLELGVHIADVTYFVQPLSSTDLEARSRSTSVYLPDRRYDMLPQVLSGNLCSLLGNVDRYAVSVLWELDSKCNVQNVWYGRTVINSRYKLCYELRRHPNPREADLLEVQKLASSKGFTLNIHSNKELAASLEKAVNVNDPTFNQILRILTTQAMNQAVYFCTGNISSSEFYHYGLGLDKYTHFTSPIRRYADILVHRQLLAEAENSEANVKFDAGEMTDLCNHMNIKHRAAQDLEKAAQQIYLAYFFEDYSRQNSSPCLVDAIIYSLLTNGMLVFIPKYGIKGAVSLCNKDKKVAVVKEGVEWLEGQLTIKNSYLTVEASGMIQKYSIFDHVTLSVRVQKSRAHQHKIILDLVRNEPYASDLITLPDENIEMLPIKSETGSEEITKNVNENLLLPEAKTFNLYDFLENLRALTLIDYNDTSFS